MSRVFKFTDGNLMDPVVRLCRAGWIIQESRPHQWQDLLKIINELLNSCEGSVDLSQLEESYRGKLLISPYNDFDQDGVFAILIRKTLEIRFSASGWTHHPGKFTHPTF